MQTPLDLAAAFGASPSSGYDSLIISLLKVESWKVTFEGRGGGGGGAGSCLEGGDSRSTEVVHTVARSE